MGWRFILSLIFSVVIALFAIANAGSVRVNFVFAVYEVSQAIVILVSAIVGAVIVMLLSIVKTIKQNLKINNQEKTIMELEKEKGITARKLSDLEKKFEELTLEQETVQIAEEITAQQGSFSPESQK